MTDERTRITKIISFAIGMSGSVRPERMAVSVLDELERHYQIIKLETGHGSNQG